MIKHMCIQGSEQWRRLRAGIVTASCLSEIITPVDGKLSKSAGPYMHRLLAERILGYPIETITTAAMQTGHEREPEARAWFELTRGVEIEQVGFCTLDDGLVGASPDGLIGDDGAVEIKAPNAETHVGYLLAKEGIAPKYKPQIMGQLWVCERDWLDSISYCHGFPAAVFRVERDHEYIAKMIDAVGQFLDMLEWNQRKLLALGCTIAEPASLSQIADVVGVDPFGVEESDVAAIWAGRQQ